MGWNRNYGGVDEVRIADFETLYSIYLTIYGAVPVA